MKRYYVSCSALLGGFLAMVLVAQPAVAFGPGRHGHAPEARLQHDLDRLGLSSDQLQQVQAILDAAKVQREQTHAQLRAAFDAMHTLLEQDTPDEAAVMAQADKIATLKTAAEKNMLHTLLAVRAQLTPEQRQKLKDMHEHDAPPWRGHPGTSPRGLNPATAAGAGALPPPQAPAAALPWARISPAVLVRLTPSND